jgi:hypothetical protein
MRGRYLILGLVLILLAASVSATSSYENTAIDNTILFGEKALFEITIDNLREEAQAYTVFPTASSISWDIRVLPLGTDTIVIGSQESKTIQIEAQPIGQLDPGVYLFNIKFETNFGESHTESLKVYIDTEERRDYLPSLTGSIDMNEKIDPRETQSIKLFLENDNWLDLSNLLVTLKSDIPEFNQFRTLNVGPFENKAVEFTIVPNPHQQPKDYILFFVVERNNETIKVIEKFVEIIPLTHDFEKSKEEIKSFLKSVDKVTITNTGNVRNTQQVRVEVSSFGDLFTATYPESTVIKEDGKRYRAWEIELGPEESIEVLVSTSYRIPVVILIILIVSLILYFWFRNPVYITKSASNIEMNEGSVSGLKVNLVVKNAGSKPIKDCEVFDTVPSIASVEKDVEVGTLNPSDILRTKGGSILLKWKISEIDSKEERLITYKIKSKLDIVGDFKLPRAKITFKDARHRKGVSYSNAYLVGSPKNKR